MTQGSIKLQKVRKNIHGMKLEKSTPAAECLFSWRNTNSNIKSSNSPFNAHKQCV
jgi:hypothetical protein